MGINYSDLLDNIIKKNLEDKKTPSLLLHSCCAPCSSYVIEYLSKYFNITILYYNPNISPYSEYEKRKQEQIRLVKTMDVVNPVSFLDCDYDNNLYEDAICGLELEPERGKRCHVCFNLRLDKTASMARDNDFDYFGTTLTVSPYKDSVIINTIGKELEEKYNVSFLSSDFKKKNGYKRSIELSKEYGLYRQNYCGCKYSKRD